jgi:hypothetical protein
MFIYDNIHNTGTAKFVLLKDAYDNIILRSNEKLERHRDLVKAEQDSGTILKQVLGGGWLRIKDNEVNAYGESKYFGIASSLIMQDILTKKFPNHIIKLNLGNNLNNKKQKK